MTRKRAIRLAAKLAGGYVSTLREGEAQEYHELCLDALREQESQKAMLVQQYIKVPEKPQWISVKDKLPEAWKAEDGDLINYLVYMPEYGVDVGNYAQPVKAWLCMGIPCKVTHWMPLPEPPKEEV